MMCKATSKIKCRSWRIEVQRENQFNNNIYPSWTHLDNHLKNKYLLQISNFNKLSVIQSAIKKTTNLLSKWLSNKIKMEGYTEMYLKIILPRKIQLHLPGIPIDKVCLSFIILPHLLIRIKWSMFRPNSRDIWGTSRPLTRRKTIPLRK